MKKNIRISVSLIIGGIIAIDAYNVTDRKRKKAIEAGIHVPYGLYEAIIKRPLDILVAGIALVFLSPVICMVAILVKIKLGSPVLFIQQRPGLNENIFTILKFRTMTNERGYDGELLPDDERLTHFGKMLRRMSLDELPELINIIKGDMSLVGPRPLLVEYLPRYSEQQKHRHDVRPGLTGLAQISGRNSLSWDEKFKADEKYVEKITFLKDLKIILKTISVVLHRSGISSENSETMEVFTGK